MANRLIEFSVEDLYNLMVHYAQGELPLNGQVKALQVSDKLPRWINLIIESNEWENTPFKGDGYGGIQPFIFRYEGNRTLNLGHMQDTPQWGEIEAVEAPKRQ